MRQGRSEAAGARASRHEAMRYRSIARADELNDTEER